MTSDISINNNKLNRRTTTKMMEEYGYRSFRMMRKKGWFKTEGVVQYKASQFRRGRSISGRGLAVGV